jgi:DNA-binding beta-propeller fold protein YncE
MARSPQPQKNTPADALERFLKEHRLKITGASARKFLKELTAAPAESGAVQQAIAVHQSIVAEASFRAEESGASQLSPPSGLAWSRDGRLIVADDFNHRIQIYGADRRLIREFGVRGKNPGELQYPKGLAVDAQNNIYVADSWNHRVQKFSADGKPLQVFGQYGEERGQLDEPYAVLVGDDGVLIVVERYNHRIQFFSPDGRSLGWIGARGSVLEEKLAYLFQTPQTLLPPGLFEFPTAIAKDSIGNYYIVDSGNHRIVKFDSQWNRIATFGDRGEGPGCFQYPMGLDIGPNDLLYVADMNNDRIQAFTTEGLFLFAVDQAGDGSPLRMPCLALAGANGELLVGLTFNTRIHPFRIGLPGGPSMYTLQTTLQPRDPRPVFLRGQLHESLGDSAQAEACYSQAVRFLTEEKKRWGDDPAFDRVIVAELAQKISRPPAHPAPTRAADILQCLDLLADGLHQARHQVHDTLREWDIAATAFFHRFMAREELVLNDKEDPRAFDREYHILEKADKTLFRKIRLQFHAYRQTTEAYGNFISALASEKTLPDDCRARLGDSLKDQLDTLCAAILEQYTAKEKSEEVMMISFSEAQDDRRKWENFRLQGATNQRRADLLRHLQFELRVLLRALRSGTATAGRLGEISEEILRPDGSHPLAKILLLTQENWEDLHHLDSLIKELADVRIAGGGHSGRVSAKTIALPDLAPVAFDTETLNPQDFLRAVWADGLPLQTTGDGIQMGLDIFRLAVGSSIDEHWSRNLDALYENQNAYQQKGQGLFEQLNTLKQQYAELSIQLQQTDVRDKKAPIPIQKNLQAVEFQISLVRRMIVTLEFNATNNALNFILCAAFLSRSPANAGWLAQVRERIKTLMTDLGAVEGIVQHILENRRNGITEKIELEKKAATADKNPGPGRLETRDQNRNRLRLIDLAMEEEDFQYRSLFKLRSLMENLLGFLRQANTFEQSIAGRAPGLVQKQSFFKQGTDLGRPSSLMGLSSLSEGGWVVSDYDNHCLWTVNGNGTAWKKIGGFGNAPGKFHCPASITRDAAGNLYVADQNNTRLQKFDGGGKLLWSGDGRDFGMVVSLSLDTQGRLWAPDPVNNRIRLFDAQGKPEKIITADACGIKEPWSILCLPDGGYLVGDNSDSVLKRFDASGRPVADLKRQDCPYGLVHFIAHSPKHGIFATHFWDQSILHLNEQLKPIAVYKNRGNRASQLGRIGAIQVVGDQLAVADFDNQTIRFFQLLA